jgi:Glycosyltransferase like family 2
VTSPPADDLFLLGEPSAPGPLARARDRLLDARLALARSGSRLDALAEAVPPREVLVLSIHRAGGRELPRAIAELRRTRHTLRVALGSMGDAEPSLAADTVATGLRGGKFENLNAVITAAPGGADWVLVVDDDVGLPDHFLDRLLGVCERLDLALAQPAQSLASHAAWPHTRRRAGSMLRETRFVEIGPVTCFRRDAFALLTPFPPLRFGWGLDLHWGAVAAERGWRLGVVDALPVRHEQAAVAAAYSSRDAIEEARAFLAGRPFVDSARASEAVRAHPLP